MKKTYEKLKKILSLIMVFVMVIGIMPPVARAATPDTLYLKPNGNWTQANARFAAYFFGNGEKWVSMTDSNGDGIYEVTVPAGYPQVIFCRMNPSASANTWNNKWNQTGDLTIPTDGKNQFTLPNGSWDGATTAWSTYVYVEPNYTYTVAGSDGLCGTGWDVANPANDMVKNESGIYEKVFQNVKAGSYEIKIARDHSWDVSYGKDGGSANYTFSVAKDGSTVTITFDVATKKITHSVVAPPDVFTATFIGNNVTSDGAFLATEGEDYIATLTAAEGYTLPETVEVRVSGNPIDTYVFENGVVTIPAAAVVGEIEIYADGVKLPNEYSVIFRGTNVTSNGAEKAVEGADYTAILTAEEGYTLPEKVSVKIGEAEAVEYTLAEGKLTIPAADITGNIEIIAVGVKLPAEYTVTFNGTNVTSNGAGTVIEGNAYTATLTAAEGYTLPEKVSVKIGEAEAKEYTLTEGKLTIPAADITGNIVITAAGVEQPEDVVLYLKPNSNWIQANARFAAYFFNNSTNKNTWVSMTDSNGDGIYEVTVPTGYPQVIFCRMNPAASANNWNNKWNQTGDLTIPTDGKNQFTLAEGVWDGATTAWSTYVYVEPNYTYTVAGSEGLCGSNWDPADTTNDMVKNANGLYVKEYTNVAAGNYEFKVVRDHAWGVEFGQNGNNYPLTIAKNGSTVTITFDPVSKEIGVNVEVPVEEYTVTFNGTNVTSNGAATVIEGNTYTATLTAAEGYTLPEKVSVKIGEAEAKEYTLAEGKLTILAADITGNIEITAVGVELAKEYSVSFNGTNVTSNGAGTVIEGNAYTATLTAAEGYTLPEKVSVKIGEAEAVEYTLAEGKLTIPAADIIGNIEITAVGEAEIVEPETMTIYFENNWGWPDAKIYWWGSAIGENPAWPGVSMTYVDTTNDGYDRYVIEVPTDVAGIIFNGTGGYGAEQSADITSGWYDGICYYMTYDSATNTKPAMSYQYEPIVPEDPAAAEYYLVGYINGADLGIGDDSANLGSYKFVDGKVTVEMTSTSYVVVKDSTGKQYWAPAFCQTDSTVLAEGNGEKMQVDVGTYEFTLVENADGTLTLSYVKQQAAVDTATYILAGDSTAVFGTAWDTANEANKLTYNAETGLYEITYTGVNADFKFKVTDGTWSNCWGSANASGDIGTADADGNCLVPIQVTDSTVTVTFNADTKAIAVTVTEGEGGEVVEKNTYTAIFHFANTIGWSPLNLYVWNDAGATTGSWPGSAVTKLDANGYQTMTVSYEAATNPGLNYIFNNGSLQTVDLTLAADKFDAETNTAEVWVELNASANAEGKYTTKRVETAPFADLVLAVSPRIDGDDVTFAFAGDSNTTGVELRGTVPGASWDRGIALTKNENGLWEVTVTDVAPGVYEYKFVVNGSEWTTDPANGKTNAEGNSIFTIADPNAVDNNEITINVYYNRADGTYTVANADGGATGIWNAYVWGTNLAGIRKDYAADADGKMMFTMKVVGRDTLEVALKNRLSTAGKDWLKEESQVTIDLKEIVSGTVNVYIESNGANGMNGSTTYSVVSGTDVVFGNKVTSAQYDYEKDAIVVKTIEALNSADELILKSPTGGATIKSVSASGTTYTIKLNGSIALHEMEQYKVVYDGYEYDIAIDNVYATKKFADEYTYNGKDLGANYTAGGTTFKVWAPTATGVNVLLYADGNALDKFGNHANASAPIGTYPMEYTEKGVWAVTVPGDLNGTYYTYQVFFGTESVEAVDPYARTTGVNGMRGMVIDLDATDPADGWSEITNKPASYTDAVIYELHVRDFSIDDSSGVKDQWQGKFLGLTQTGTTTAGGTSTGLDYLKELGITHLHLLPIYDYASVDETTCSTFNWGYDPQNYNVPEGSYSTNPYDGASRVKEMKEMVDTLHENNIGVIMDVVYNHVYDAGTFCFNNIVPGYFSRPNSNTSGCGNDTASEREMVRKYIVESVLYWAEEYHIDGFRFDLVGLLDVETIKQIVAEVHAYRPDIIFYGEGWDMDSTNKEPGTEMAKQGNASKTPGFAYFSDSMRNGIGGNNGHSTGFASGAGNGSSMVTEWMAKPWWTGNPSQIIQYASCHDNYTLADKLILSTNAGSLTSDVIRMNNLAAAFYMTSQGVPFIHAGEEFLREKLNESGKRVENSYNASDFVNHLEWSNLDKAEYAKNVEYYKGLIAFRAAHPALRYATASQVSANVSNLTAEGNLLVFRVDANGTASTEDEDILVIFNANKGAKTVTLPEGEWTIYVNGEKAGTTALGTAEGSVSVAGISAMVLTASDLGEDEDAPQGPSGEKTIYFTNNKGWTKVYAYAWTDGGEKLLLGAWPGTEATFYKTNDYGEPVYSITLPASETGIEGVIFSNGSDQQTVDIVPGVDGTGYYPTETNEEGKWNVGTWTERAPVLGGADEYFLVGYINGNDYVGGDYKFNENGFITVTFDSDSYVYVVNGTNTETYMTDGYLGAVTGAILKDTAKHSLTADQWDKLLIPGGAEVYIGMTKSPNNTVMLMYETNAKSVQDTSGIQDGVTLHCWNWSFAEIERQIPTIAAMGYTAIQTSPVQAMKEATNTSSVGSHWWVYYQPVDFVITTDEGNALGTKAELASMVETAHNYGIQVIVDVVANHLGNQTGNDLSDKIPEYLRKDEYWHDINTNITNWNDRYDMTQNCLDGLPDLNTANDEIQQYVLDFLKECIDIGVDGFRFDMAKSIETPRDEASFASDFWPTVIGGAEEYAATKGKDVYMYGEVLDNAVIPVSAYTEYMAVTDNGWGNNLRNNIVSGTAALSKGYHKAANASNLVIWAESHDTFATSDAGQSSAGVSELDINKTWALVAARADAMGLYFARPESLNQTLGVASVTGWDNPEVAAVNKFHNLFAGQSESLHVEGDIAYVVRGTKGAVLVNAQGTACDVNVIGYELDSETYIDQITGNIFTMIDSRLCGKIGDTGIAVLYNQAEYEIIRGADSVWNKASTAGLIFRANGKFEKFTGVAVDGQLLSAEHYTTQSSHMMVTLKAAYLATLADGEHTLEILFVDGSAGCSFTVEAAAEYKVVEGNGAVWSAGKLTFVADGPFDKFQKVQIDGEDIDEIFYNAKAGSTVIDLIEDYLSTLPLGEHTIGICYTDGKAIGNFTILEYNPSVPETTVPETSVPETTVPETSVPETTVPETTVPETTVPETTVPETTVPETTVPETTVPETSVPETSVPETTVPETTVPETTVPETSVPETTVPETTVPETSVPETSVPEATAPETTVPETTVPEITVPETTVPVTTVPEITVPETTVPETTVPETTVPETTAPESVSPPTGDESNIFLWSMIMLFSAAAAAALISMKKRFGEE